MIKLLAKANDDVLSHCRCVGSLASMPSQLDCPWCGCGWLISCTQCRRAFTFARVVEADTDYRAFVSEDRARGEYNDDDPGELDSLALWLEESLADFEVGRTISYFDGRYFDLEAKPIEFEGLFARHKLKRLPHLDALSSPGHLRAALGAPSYWLERERPGRDDDD